MTYRNQTSNAPFVQTYDPDQLGHPPFNMIKTIVFDSLHTQGLKTFSCGQQMLIWWRLKLIWVFTGSDSTHHIVGFLTVWLLRHNAGQEGRGEILLENSFLRWRCYQGKIMHTTSKNFSVLYVLRKHQQHINIQWHHLRCYFWLIDHPILEQVATPRSFQLEPILDCPVLDVRQLVRNKRRKEYD